VLLVEDDAAVRRALLRLLTLAGFETLTASSLAGALEQLISLPDIVLTDVKLPDGSGLDLVHRIRRQDQTVAVAVMSGGDDAFVGHARASHPDAVFRKPFDVSDLMSWMNDPRPRACWVKAP
jgi:DNA-binding response OmpR family regulator